MCFVFLVRDGVVLGDIVAVNPPNRRHCINILLPYMGQLNHSVLCRINRSEKCLTLS